jgi:hypothetical protein
MGATLSISARLDKGGLIPVTPVAPTDFHDREWWAQESARVGSDWSGVLETHFDALQRLGFIEPVRSSFWFACRDADLAARKRGGRR